MRRVYVVAVIMLLLSAPGVKATIVEIPLPELGGRYFLYDTFRRSCTFQLPQRPAMVHGAWLHLTGVATIRLTDCGYDPFEPYPERVDFVPTMPDPTTGGGWGGQAFTPPESGPFELTIEFHTASGASWRFLEDTVGEIELVGIGWSILDLCYPLTEWSEAFVEQAVLVFDAEFPIPVEENTWGSIKALFEGSN
jgi:hypothetical protein